MTILDLVWIMAVLEGKRLTEAEDCKVVIEYTTVA